MRKINKEECTPTIRVGVCKHTNRRVLQQFDGSSEDAIDKAGWFCLHEDTITEEQEAILYFLYKLDMSVSEN